MHRVFSKGNRLLYGAEKFNFLFMYFQGIPGPPGQLGFSEITMNTLKVSWEEPERPNGEILGYIVAYETAEQDESEF